MGLGSICCSTRGSLVRQKRRKPACFAAEFLTVMEGLLLKKDAQILDLSVFFDSVFCSCNADFGGLQMCQMEQEEPCKAVVAYNSHQVVDGGNQRAGGHGGVDVHLFEKKRYSGAGDGRELHT